MSRAFVAALLLASTFTFTSSCRPTPPPKIGWLAAAGSDDDEPPPVELVYQPLPPIDIGVLNDEAEGPCADPVRQIHAATTALDRLWILDYDGRLSSFDRALGQRQSHLVNKVVDVIRRAEDGSLWAVINETNRWRVVRRDASGWRHLADLPVGRRDDDALTERDGRPVLATSERKTFWFDAAGLMHLWTAPPPRTAGQTSAVAASGGAIYIGRDVGEFGGELEAIHVGGPARRTTQEYVIAGETTGVVVDPTDRRCVIASQGCEHGFSTGRVVRSCPGDLSIVLQIGERESLAFYKVIANGSTVYAVGREETYAITGSTTRRLARPAFAERCGLSVAQLEGLMFIRDPRRIERHPDVIGYNRFVVPALVVP